MSVSLPLPLAEEPEPDNIDRCFIVRIDPDLNAEIETYRARLEKTTRKKVSLAEAARKLFREALENHHPRGKKFPRRQLILFR